jgi:branched-chain amino acid transport system substrate-binding protein
VGLVKKAIHSGTTKEETKVKRLIVVFIVSVLILGCSRQPNPNQPDRSPIRIGFFGDLSGPTFNFGQSAKNGMLMAVDQINLAGGINGRKLDIVIDDDRGSPERAAELAGKTNIAGPGYFDHRCRNIRQ